MGTWVSASQHPGFGDQRARAARIHRMESMPRRQKVRTFDIERQAGQGPCVLNAYWHYSQPAKRQATDSASAARTGEEMVLATIARGTRSAALLSSSARPLLR